MTLRDHLGPRTPENAALHDELDRLEASRDTWKAIAKTAEAGLDATYGAGWRGQCVHGKWDWESCDQCSKPTDPITLTRAEYDRLLAARAVALDEVCQVLEDPGDNTSAQALGQRLCCSGHHCGCMGADVGTYLMHLIRALATTDSSAALDRVIRAHVEKALEMAKRSIVPDMTYKVEWQSSRGELVLNVEQILTEPVVARARLIWETSKEEAFAASGDTVEEAISRCIAWAAENAYEVPEAAPQPVTADDVLREMGGRGCA